MANTTAAKSEENGPAPAQQPVIVIDVGKASRSSVKKLKRGRGKLMAEVNEVLAQVKHELAEETEGREIVPVALVYKKKRSRKTRRGLLSIFD